MLCLADKGQFMNYARPINSLISLQRFAVSRLFDNFLPEPKFNEDACSPNVCNWIECLYNMQYMLNSLVFTKKYNALMVTGRTFQLCKCLEPLSL